MVRPGDETGVAMSGSLSEHDRHLVTRRWNEHTSGTAELSDQVYWLAIPEVMRRHQRNLTGGRFEGWVDAVVFDYFAGRMPVERVLSLGCGDGALERDLARLNFFNSCDARDLSPVAIEKARTSAAEAGLVDRIHYDTVDLNAATFPVAEYDSIWFNGSLHHIVALEHVLDQCHRALKPGGYLIVNEYVGPNRFDFTARQKQAMEASWQLIPERLKRSCIPGHSGSIQLHAPLPDPAEVAAVDPSEAVRSADIVPELRSRFEICCERKAGGTILQFLLAGIAGNFRTADPESIRILEMLFEIEDSLIEVGDLDSDFMLFVART
jgi:SAM-dependent methyltransferase